PSGFLVITGRNGTGKSTLIDAIEFVLTGTIDKYPAEAGGRETIRDYLWWRGSQRASAYYVALGLVDDVGVETRLLRSRDDGPTFSESEVESLLCAPDARPTDALKNMCRTSIVRDEYIAALSWDQSEVARFEFVRA